MKRSFYLTAVAALSLGGCGQNEAGSDRAGNDAVPSGTYAVDRSHTYVTFSYLHQGLSYPLLRATDVDGELEFDSEEIANSEVSIVVAANSIRTNVDHFDKELASRKFFNAEKYPHIIFDTDTYEPTSESEGILHGNVTIRGISRPLELAVTLNDALIHPVSGIPVIGFSARSSLTRSDFGLDRFVPAVSDTVAFNIEIEFLHGSNENSATASQLARNASAER